ncbi:MAG: class I SAM-dependent methyltransferase, partial [Campylobacterales bacterium]
METKSFWEKIADHYPNYNDPSLIADARKLLDFAREAGVVWEEERVIDIGCGSGAMALELAREAREVVALDTAQGMLAKLEAGIRATGARGIIPVLGSWDSFAPIQPSGSFKMGVASMTPAISSHEGLSQMVRVCRHGIIAAWGSYRRNSFAEALFAKLGMVYDPPVNGIRRIELGLKKLGVVAAGPFYFETAWERELDQVTALNEA